jgi:hypothetical protein
MILFRLHAKRTVCECVAGLGRPYDAQIAVKDSLRRERSAVNEIFNFPSQCPSSCSPALKIERPLFIAECP